MRRSISFCLFFTLLTLLGCNVDRQRREINTLANLQSLAYALDDEAGGEGAVRSQHFKLFVETFFRGGKDLWGNPIIFISASDSNKSTFLLISMGSDGQLDVADPLMYYDIDEPLRSPDQGGNDIVIRGKRKAVSYGASK